MLLQRLVEYAERGTDQLPSMYQIKPIRYEIRLDADGRQFVPILPLANPANKATKRGEPRLVPHRKRTVGIAPILLADNAEYAFGIAREASKPDRVVRQHEAFIGLVKACAAETNEPTVRAVVAFLTESGPRRRSDLVLPSDFDPTGDVGFVVDGVRPVDLPTVRAFWAAQFAATESTSLKSDEPDEKSSERFLDPKRLSCIACGNVRPVLKRHRYKLKGVPGGQLGGTDLISANSGAFESYGLRASEVAPVCYECGEKYLNALNKLLADDSTHLQVGNVLVYVFWTAKDTASNPGTMFSEPDSEGMIGQVRELILAFNTARVAAINLDPMPFYALALSANSSRTVVREWIDQTVGEANQTLARYFALQEIVDWDGREGMPLRPKALASATVRAKSDPSPSVPAALLGLALRGDTLPQNIAFEAIRRCRIEGGVSRERAALIKMTIGSRPGTTPEEIKRMTDLDANQSDPAYLCGRLFAVLDRIQHAALGRRNATVVDKYYGSASSAPASVFGKIIGDAQPHLSKIQKERGDGAYNALQKRLAEIMKDINATTGFPKTLTLHAQGLFALGYYHQRASDIRAAREAKERGQSDVSTTLDPDSD